MSTLADQIRELQQKLDQINEAPADAANSYAGAQAATVASGQPDDAAGVDAAVAQQAAPASAPATDPNQIPTIDAPTFSQAYAQAAKQGLKKFKWCGVYAVKAKPRPKPPQPQPATKPTGKVDWTGQADPLGGDMQNPMSFAPNSNFGA